MFSKKLPAQLFTVKVNNMFLTLEKWHWFSEEWYNYSKSGTLFGKVVPAVFRKVVQVLGTVVLCRPTFDQLLPVV